MCRFLIQLYNCPIMSSVAWSLSVEALAKEEPSAPFISNIFLHIQNRLSVLTKRFYRFLIHPIALSRCGASCRRVVRFRPSAPFMSSIFFTYIAQPRRSPFEAFGEDGLPLLRYAPEGLLSFSFVSKGGSIPLQSASSTDPSTELPPSPKGYGAHGRINCALAKEELSAPFMSDYLFFFSCFQISNLFFLKF